MFKPSIAIKGAMKDLDYVYDFVKNLQKAKDVGKKLEDELGRKVDKIDIELAREHIAEVNDYLQAVNVVKGKLKDVLATLANVVDYLENKKESFEEQAKEDKQVRELINKIKEYNPKVKILKEVDNKDEVILFLEGEKKGMLTIDVDRYKAIFEYEDEGRTRKLYYDLTDEKDYENLLHDISFYLTPPKLEEKKEEVDDLDKKIDEIIQKYKQKGIELDKEKLKYLIQKYGKIKEEVEQSFEEDSKLVDSKLSPDGVKVDLVKVGDKYYIFSGDRRLGPYDDELEARQDFIDLIM